MRPGEALPPGVFGARPQVERDLHGHGVAARLQAQPGERSLARGGFARCTDRSLGGLSILRRHVLPHDRVHDDGAAAGRARGQDVRQPLRRVRLLHSHVAFDKQRDSGIEVREATRLIGPDVRAAAGDDDGVTQVQGRDVHAAPRTDRCVRRRRRRGALPVRGDAHDVLFALRPEAGTAEIEAEAVPEQIQTAARADFHEIERQARARDDLETTRGEDRGALHLVRLHRALEEVREHIRSGRHRVPYGVGEVFCLVPVAPARRMQSGERCHAGVGVVCRSQEIQRAGEAQRERTRMGGDTVVGEGVARRAAVGEVLAQNREHGGRPGRTEDAAGGDLPVEGR